MATFPEWSTDTVINTDIYYKDSLKQMSVLLHRFAHLRTLEPFMKQLNPLWCEVEY